MIYSVTLNPSLDRILDVEDLVPDDANRVVEETRWAGGKGIDASRVIRRLGGESVALGFIGGFTGLEVEGRLINEGVLTRFVRVAGETRTNVFVRNRKTSTQTSLNSQGPQISPREVAEIFNQIRDLSDPATVFLCGSIPRGVNAGFYAQLILTLKEKGTFVILDADGEALERGAAVGPSLIKPNAHEFARLIGRPAGSHEEIVDSSREMIRNGVGSVLATLGKHGMIFVPNQGPALFAKAPPVETVSTIGAGDATLAGFVMGRQRGEDPVEWLRLASAAGAATAMTPGVELCHQSDVDQLLPDVEVREI
jgi:6-phosphofructokinase 2